MAAQKTRQHPRLSKRSDSHLHQCRAKDAQSHTCVGSGSGAKSPCVSGLSRGSPSIKQLLPAWNQLNVGSWATMVPIAKLLGWVTYSQWSCVLMQMPTRAKCKCSWVGSKGAQSSGDSKEADVGLHTCCRPAWPTNSGWQCPAGSARVACMPPAA